VATTRAGTPRDRRPHRTGHCPHLAATTAIAPLHHLVQQHQAAEVQFPAAQKITLQFGSLGLLKTQAKSKANANQNDASVPRFKTRL